MSDLPLLPSDKYIASLLGLTDEQYRFYMAEVRRRAAAQPRPAVVNEPATLSIIALVSTVISIGLTIAASFFKPSQSQPGSLTQNQIQGGILSDSRRYAPKQGFDANQDIASLGDPIPLIYAKRELIGDRYYGGLRVNAPLVWSQIQSYSKSQLLRAVFMLGEGSITSIDPANIAIGNNTLGSYLIGDTTLARFSVYYRPDGGRLTATDHLVGAIPENDLGKASDADVFGVQNEAGVVAPYFSHSRRPNTQTVFGVYSCIGNGLGYRVNPVLRPTVNAQVTADVNSTAGKKGGSGSAKARVVCELDYVALAQREKYKTRFGSRSGLIDTSGTTWRYRLSASSDANTTFAQGEPIFNWQGRAAVADNPFPPSGSTYSQGGLRDSDLVNLLSFSNIQVNGNTISGTVNFDTTRARTQLANVDDGTYVIGYYIWLEYDSGKQLAFDHRVVVDIIENRSQSPAVTREYVFTNATATYSSTYDKNDSYNEKCGDVAAAVSGRQKTWDDALLVGELYKIGSALAVCTQREPIFSNEKLADAYASYKESIKRVGRNRTHISSNTGPFYTTDTSLFYMTTGDVDPESYDAIFNSDADFDPPGNGTSVDVTFSVVRSGTATAIPENDLTKNGKQNPPFFTATNQPHIHRIAIATFATIRECRIVEIGIRSSLGIRIAGLCNFRDALTYDEINNKACLSKKGQTINPGDTLAVDIYQSGQMSSTEERYSFHRIGYREANSNAPFTQFPQCFGIRGITQQAIFNSIRFVFPSIKRWEIEIEPLTGWEIRSGIATGNLELIDSSLKTVRTITQGDVSIVFNGVANLNEPFIASAERTSLGPQVFKLTSVQRSSEIGINYSDQDSYVDAWGKLAEAFVYDEVSSSAQSSPEHEVVYINEIIPNNTTPAYTNIAILGLSMRASLEWQQLGQVSVYVTSGLQDTHLFPEILRDILLNQRYGKGDIIVSGLIDDDSFNSATAWCEDRHYYHDGVVLGRINLRQWAADVAASHLCFFGEAEGRFWLKPAWPGTVGTPEPVSIQGIFTAGNILEGSFSMEYLAPEDRQPIQVSVKYREERQSSDLNNPGLFPVEREVLVREVSPYASDTDPVQAIDLTEYVTSREHAVDAAKFVARMRRIPDHAIRFSTTHEGIVAKIKPGDYIRVVMDITHFNELRNGAVLADGTLVTTQPFSDGTYNVFAWNGSSSADPAPTVLTVSGAGTVATPTGIIFTMINAETQTRTYQIERITPQDEGGFSIEAMHMPTNDSNVLLLAAGFDDSSNWVIQG